jgi:hypothetical protein
MMKVSPDTGDVVRAVTVSVGVTLLLDAVMSVTCPLRAVVVVVLRKIRRRPLNWSVTVGPGLQAEVTTEVVLEATPTVPVTIAEADFARFAAATVSLLIERTLTPTTTAWIISV